MKAAVVTGCNDIGIREIPEPECTGGTVKVAVAYCGICGSDVPRVLKGACHSFPQVLGHEFSGKVVEVGAGVESVRPGDSVVGIPLVPCFECDDCRRGNFSLCGRYSFIGSRQQGAMAEYVVVPERNVCAIPSSIPLRDAALVEPSTVALHGLLEAGFRPESDDCVAVVGLGPIALFALQWCRIYGAKRLVAVGRSKDRLLAALENGADAAFSSLEESCVEEALKTTGGKGFSYVFDMAGTEDTIKLCLRLAAKKGQVCLVGTPTKPVAFSVKEWETINRKELWLTGTWMSYSAPWPGEEWRRTIDCLASGELKVTKGMVGDLVPFDRVKDAFARFETQRQTIKGRIVLDLSNREDADHVS